MTDRIMARLRGSVASYRTLFDGETLPDLGLEMPATIDTATEYSPQDGPEATHDLYYVVLDQEQLEKMIDPYRDAVSMGTDMIAQSEYDTIHTIYKASGRKLFFTRVSSSARIGEDGKTLIEFQEQGLVINKVSFAIDFSGKLDAYYDGRDRIYFSKFSKAKALFKDFDEFYQDAFRDDNEMFLDSALFAVSEIGPDDVSARDTKQIAEIRANGQLDLDDAETKERIQKYVKKYPLSGVVLNADGRIKITTDDDLRCVVKLLTQRYYTSEVTGEILEARGSAKMKNQKPKKIFNGEEVL